jgi:hypothetical protein
MQKLISIIFFLFFPFATFSQEEEVLEKYLWKNRLFLIFAKSAHDMDYQNQMEEIAQSQIGFLERDLIVFSIFDTQGATATKQELSAPICKKLRQKFKVDKNVFTAILIGKDGGEKYRNNAFVSKK